VIVLNDYVRADLKEVKARIDSYLAGMRLAHRRVLQSFVDVVGYP